MPYDPSLAAMRFGYGLPQPPGAPDSVKAMLAALTDPDAVVEAYPIARLADVAALLDAFLAARRLRGQGAAQDEAYRVALRALNQPTVAAARTTFARAVSNPDGFRERLAAFWGDHFTAAPREGTNKFLPFAMMDQAIRPHLTGGFADMLIAVTTHPAMLVYLDQGTSFGPTSAQGKRTKRGLNENLARELIELHTLGVGAGYAQDDVRQMAELLTGLTVTPKLDMAFEPRRAEPGEETVLGVTYRGEGLEPIRAALRDLAARPETAAHIARKLAVHFVADNPDDDLIDTLMTAFVESDGDLMTVYAVMLNHPAAWAPQMQKARQPYDFLLAALRGLNVTGDEVARMVDGPFRRMLLDPLTAMGQPFKTPPGPDGWPEEAEAWITPQGLAARITWAMEVPGRLRTPLPNPDTFAQATLGPMASERLLWAVSRAENIREGVGLVLVSPEFNRR